MENLTQENIIQNGDLGPVQERTEDIVPEQTSEPVPEAAAQAEPEPAEEKSPKKNYLLRASRKWSDIIFLTAVCVIGVQLLGEIFSNLLVRVLPVMEWFDGITHDQDISVFLLQYGSFIGIWIAFFLICIIFRSNWPMLRAIPYSRRGNTLRSILIGTLLGGGMNAFCILLSWLHGDIRLAFNEFDPTLFFAFFGCVLIQSSAEEVLCRCYQYQKLRRRYRWPVIAILGNSLLFMGLHVFNPGVTMLGLAQVFEIGVLFSLIVYFYDSLWCVSWAHATWNFSQSIVFGLPNSGIVSKYSVFKLDAATARDGIFYNTSFGVEGSLGANILIVIVILAVLIMGIAGRKGERRDYWEKMEEQNLGVRHEGEPILVAIVYLLTGLLVWTIWADPMNVRPAIEQQMQQIQEQEEQQAQQEQGQPAQPEQGNSEETGNPWTDFASAEEAAQNAGIEALTVEKAEISLGPVEPTSFRSMESLTETVVEFPAVMMTIRKGEGYGDCSGDFSTYAHMWTQDVNGTEVTCFGNDEGRSTKTIWTAGDHTYSIVVQGLGGDTNYGLSEADLALLVGGIR